MRSIAVIGLGNFGSTVAKELTQRGAHVIAVDKNKDRVEELKDSVSYAVVLNSVDESALKSAGIQDVDVALVCIGEDIEGNLLTTLLLKKIGVNKVWARATSPIQGEILKTMEVDEIIGLEEEMGKIVARSLISSAVTKHIPLSPGHSIAEINIPECFIGKTIREIDPRKKFSVNVVAVKKRKPEINKQGERVFLEVTESCPSPDLPLGAEDAFLIVGKDEDIERFLHACKAV
ncbi:MAG: TrkA family potassium uptake protein [Candidatus Omnitrophica bacterium]|nr:TrkA family potassium uptake protein [Candidatus Omnitrophota bacterium]